MRVDEQKRLKRIREEIERNVAVAREEGRSAQDWANIHAAAHDFLNGSSGSKEAFSEAYRRRVMATYGLIGSLPDSLSYLMQALRSKRSEVRADAVGILGAASHYGVGVVGPLLRVLDNPEASLEEQAAVLNALQNVTLTQSERDEVLLVLRRILESPDADSETLFDAACLVLKLFRRRAPAPKVVSLARELLAAL